jgi:glutaredoxin
MKSFEAWLAWLGLFKVAEALSLKPTPFLALLRQAPLTVFSTSGCKHCMRAKRALEAADLGFANVDVGEDASARAMLEENVGASFCVGNVAKKRLKPQVSASRCRRSSSASVASAAPTTWRRL